MATICTGQSLSVFETQPNCDARPEQEVVPAFSQRTGYVRRFLQWLEQRRDQRDSRDAFRHLLALDDSLLQDIGVVRADVERAARLPRAQDAAQVLYESAGKNRTDRA